MSHFDDLFAIDKDYVFVHVNVKAEFSHNLFVDANSALFYKFIGVSS